MPARNVDDTGGSPRRVPSVDRSLLPTTKLPTGGSQRVRLPLLLIISCLSEPPPRVHARVLGASSLELSADPYAALAPGQRQDRRCSRPSASRIRAAVCARPGLCLGPTSGR